MQACPERKEELMLDVLGELDPGMRSSWEQHLRTCEGCRMEKARLETIFSGLRQSPMPLPLTPAETHRMTLQLHNGLTAGRQSMSWWDRLRRRPQVWLPALAAACGVLFLAVFLGYRLPNLGRLLPGSRLDISRQLPQDEREIVRNLDLLKNFNTLEKLIRVVDDSTEKKLRDENRQGVRNGGENETIRHYA
jgi:hypothetical protein